MVSTAATARAAGVTTGPHQGGRPLAADVDLASRWLGGSVLAASDESFGEKENLLTPGPAAFEPGHYGNRGEIVDGWETRRRRGDPGHDWAIVRLGAAGVISSVDIDTSFFTGNFPESCSVEACGRQGYPSVQELRDPGTEWIEIVARSALLGDTHNIFPVEDARRFTHVRLSAIPDGGIARLRVLGRVIPDPRLLDGLSIDLASQDYGGAVIASSDGFYTSASLLNRPDTARTMGEGWETRRRRDAGHDFVVFRLAFPGSIRQAVIDTAHFKYNASAAVALFGSAEDRSVSPESSAWFPLLDRVPLQPDTRHVLPIAPTAAVSTVRLDAYPDGGLSRVRLLGSVDPVARRHAGYSWFNVLPDTQVQDCLAVAGTPVALAREIVSGRPLAEGWRAEFAGRAEASALDVIEAMLEGPAGQREALPDLAPGSPS